MDNGTITYYESATEAATNPLVMVNNAQGHLNLKKIGRRIYENDFTEDKALEGAEFEIYKYKLKNGQLQLDEKVGTGLSQSNSQIEFYNLEKKNVTNTNWLDAGDYVIKEISVGESNEKLGYKAGYLGKFTIISNQLTKEVTEIDNSGQVIGQPGESIINESLFGRFTIQKVDQYNPNKKLKGVEFEIYTKNGSTYTKVSIQNMVTNDEGIAKSPLLPAGDYYLKEVKTLGGYVLNSEYLGPYIVNKQEVTQSVSVTNVMKQSLKVIKIDSESKNEITN